MLAADAESQQRLWADKFCDTGGDSRCLRGGDVGLMVSPVNSVTPRTSCFCAHVEAAAGRGGIQTVSSFASSHDTKEGEV